MRPSPLFPCDHPDVHTFGTGRRLCRICNETLAPISHANDPITSHEAAEDITRSGRRATDATLVLTAVQKLPGSTSTELAGMIPDLTLYAVRRRLTDLHHADKVRQGEPKTRNGERKQVTWWPNA